MLEENTAGFDRKRSTGTEGKQKRGRAVKDGWRGGFRVCTSEVLGERKIGEGAAKVAWPRSLTDWGFTPGFRTRGREGAVAVRKDQKRQRSPEALARPGSRRAHASRIRDCLRHLRIARCARKPHPLSILHRGQTILLDQTGWRFSVRHFQPGHQPL